MRFKKIIILFFLVIFSLFLSCSSIGPDETAGRFLNYIKAFDIDSAKTLLNKDSNSYDFINSVFTFDNSYQQGIAYKTFTKMEYKIISSDNVEKNYKLIKVKVKHVDFMMMTEEIIPKLLEDDMQYISEEAMEKIVMEHFTERLSSSTTPLVETEINIQLYKNDGKWYIIPDEELLNAISGNLVMAYQLVGEI